VASSGLLKEFDRRGEGAVDATAYIHCTHGFHLVGDEARHQSESPRLDFVDAPRVFEGATYTFEDDRFSYGEQRFVTLGLLAGIPVVNSSYRERT